MADQRQSFFILGDQTTRKTLAGTYSAANTSAEVRIGSSYQVALDVEYTMGAAETGNSIEIRVRFASPLAQKAPTSTDWYQQVSESTSSGATTISLQEYTFDSTQSAGTYDRFHIDIPVDSKFMEVAIKETGISSNGGSASVKVILSERY